MKKLLALAAALSLGLVDAQARYVKYFNTTAELVAANVGDVSKVAIVLEFSGETDGGAVFYYDAASTAATNATTVFAPATGAGRWLRTIIPGSGLGGVELGDNNTWTGVQTYDAGVLINSTLQITSASDLTVEGEAVVLESDLTTALLPKQTGSLNLTNWSALATTSKQDASANLTNWSAIATTSKQDTNAILTALSTNTIAGTGTLVLSSVTAAKQDAAATLTSLSTNTITGTGRIVLESGIGSGDTNAWLADTRARTDDLDFGGFDLLNIGVAAFSNLNVSTLTVTNPIAGVSLTNSPQVDTDMVVLGGVARTTWPESSSSTGIEWDIDVTGTTTNNETITLWTNTPPDNTMWDAEINVIAVGETNSGAWKLMRTVLNNDGLSHIGNLDWLRTNYSIAALATSPTFAITGSPDHWALRVTGVTNEPMSWSARGMLQSVPFLDLTDPTAASLIVGPSGTNWSLAFSEPVTVGADGWTNGLFVELTTAGTITFSYASGDGTSSINYTSAEVVYPDDTLADGIDYTQPGDGIKDTSGNLLATFDTLTTFTNQSQVGTLCDVERDSVAGTPTAGSPLGYSTSTYYMASRFDATASYTVCNVALLMKGVGTPTHNVVVRFYSHDSVNDQPDSPIGSVSSSFALSELSTTEFEEVNFDASASLTSGSTYWIVVISDGYAGSNYGLLGRINENLTNSILQSTDGTTWALQSSTRRTVFTTYSN